MKYLLGLVFVVAVSVATFGVLNATVEQETAGEALPNNEPTEVLFTEYKPISVPLAEQSTADQSSVEESSGAPADRTALEIPVVNTEALASEVEDENLQPKLEVTLDLPNEEQIAPRLEVYEPIEDGFLWQGQDEDGTATLVVKNDKTYGLIESNNRTYEISPSGETHVIKEVVYQPIGPKGGDDSVIQPDHANGGETTGPVTEEPTNNVEANDSSEESTVVTRDTSATPVEKTTSEAAEVARGQEIIIDLLVAYTPEARQERGSTEAMLAHIDVQIAYTNQALRNSQASFQYRKSGTLEVDPGNFDSSQGSWLEKMYYPNDGVMDELHDVREETYSDLTALLVSTAELDSYCGWGYINGEWSVTRVSCPGTFAHELGHNLGAHHDWYVNDTQSSAHGYVQPQYQWRTIMAYWAECWETSTINCKRIQHYSNPSVKYNNEPTGLATSNTNCQTGVIKNQCGSNNAAAMNANALNTANYRVPPTTTPPQPPTTQPPTTNPTTERVSIKAQGYTGEELMVLEVNGNDVKTWQVGTGYTTYYYDLSVEVTSLKVKFVNDYYEPPVDRNLQIESVVFGGQTYYTTNLYSSGVWSAADGCAPGFRQGTVLSCNGYFEVIS